MAKANRVTAVSAAVSEYINAEVFALADVDVVAQEFSACKTHAAALALANILDLRHAFADDTSGYLAACEDIFGTSGLHYKAEGYRAGSLRPALEDAIRLSVCTAVPHDDDATKKQRAETDEMRAAETARRFNALKYHLGERRKVASYLADPVRLAMVKPDDTFAGTYKAAKLASTPTVKTDDKALAPAKVQTITTAFAEFLGVWGWASLLNEEARILATERKTRTQAATLAAIAVQLTA